MNQFLRFCIVGTIGFLVDAGVLQFLVVWGKANPYWARVVSFVAAASITWLLNRRVTFAVTHRASGNEWLRYVSAMLLGAIVNYAIYALFITFLPLALAHPWVGVAAGSLGGMGLNYTTSRMVLRSRIKTW